MLDLDRIEKLFSTIQLSAERFERCAQDLLTEIYPGLTPIVGGSDWGRDADINSADSATPARLLATSSRTLPGVMKNMRRSLRSLKEHGVPVDRIVLANPADLNLLQRNKLSKAARAEGAHLPVSDIFDRHFFAGKLRRDGYWRRELLGLSAQGVSLSRLSPDLAESPWLRIPLVGRDSDVAALSDCSGDVVVTGPPGVGKSRVLSQVSGIIFVDPHAGIEKICEELRWYGPKIVAIDDAGRLGELIHRLLWLRSQENDVFNFRILAACWQDEIDGMTASLKKASLHEVRLLERPFVNQIVLSMGISSELARREILDQSEGRAGWAIALGDALLGAKGAETLLNGQALYGQVSRYLGRAGVSRQAKDVLGLIASLGGIQSDDFNEVASELGISKSEIVSLLANVEKSGLIDIESIGQSGSLGPVRALHVRPRMLADVLVAERVFSVAVPALSMDSIKKRWPDRLSKIAASAIGAARIGAPGARRAAELLFEDAMNEDTLGMTPRVHLMEQYAALDAPAGRRVIEILSELLGAAHEAGSPHWIIDPFTDIVFEVARWHSFPDAVRILLDEAILDTRDAPPHPRHPLRKLEDIVHSFHPGASASSQVSGSRGYGCEHLD